MSAAKERRKAARAAKFSGHEPDATYHQPPSTTPTTTGREYDSERTEKTPTSDVGTSSSPKIKTDETGEKRDDRKQKTG